MLERFGERLRSFHPNRVRAVATNTFRVARNTRDFLPAPKPRWASHRSHRRPRRSPPDLLGRGPYPAPSPNKRLVIDIGGGSTEVIIGKGHEPTLMSSLYMGCVSYSRQFFRTA